ncbi:MAG: phosphate/phosphite/phosphonate ABC transporter substrate-binding protein [Labilithrix sp.]|nr:phosphate/phosphite/phosphonate ABC transporter substrate-binding protein [Labilithrix sp.]
MTSSRIVFGLVVPAAATELAERVDAMTRIVGEQASLAIERRSAASYEALATDVREGRVDVAWLPPIVFVRLADAVVPLGSIMRGGKSAYEAALVVRADSRIKTIDALRGSRAGWVDPWSAAGFVLPRMKLALLGIDPRTAFRTETFHGTHRAAVQALVEGACDVVGTYAREGSEGPESSGAWSEVAGAEVRVIATFGAIPPDVIAARKELQEEVREKVLGALRAAGKVAAMTAALRELFGGDELREGLAPGYDALKSALEMASARGLFD